MDDESSEDEPGK